RSKLFKSSLPILGSLFLLHSGTLIVLFLDPAEPFVRAVNIAFILIEHTGITLLLLLLRDTKLASRNALILGGLELVLGGCILGLPDFRGMIWALGLLILTLYTLTYGCFIIAKKGRGWLSILLYGGYLLVLSALYSIQIIPGMGVSRDWRLLMFFLQVVLFSCFVIFAIHRKLPINPDPVLSDYVDQISIVVNRFIPREFIQILEKPSVVDLQLGDHIKREMTIFFSDIRQFTALAEDLTPEENFKFINSYLERIVPAITRNGGFVDKYMGDGVMALFPNEGGADAAVTAAIDIQRILIEYNSHRAKCNYRPLAMGIGLHTGPLMLGVVGVRDRMQNTVVSDSVNLASRLESITKVFNISIAISEETFKSLKDPGAYMYRFIGKVRVKGKAEPVSVFEIFDGIDPELLERKMRANSFFEQGMLSYYRKDFTDAMYQFRKVLEILPEDGAAVFYLDNCMLKVQA
ncbi:MAG: adenylate/guanylate cyclase domain-containing protein, partial [Termitinemataceae bacterium]